jgi:hypothetical protein
MTSALASARSSGAIGIGFSSYCPIAAKSKPMVAKSKAISVTRKREKRTPPCRGVLAGRLQRNARASGDIRRFVEKA